jgi:hypothetical protein
MLCAFASYGTQFASFVVLRTKYATIKREFTSPLGMAGAVYGFVVFTLPFIAICGFQENFIAIATFIVFIAIITLYYVCVAQERQFFSEEEKEVMFRAYLMKSKELYLALRCTCCECTLNLPVVAVFIITFYSQRRKSRENAQGQDNRGANHQRAQHQQLHQIGVLAYIRECAQLDTPRQQLRLPRRARRRMQWQGAVLCHDGHLARKYKQHHSGRLRLRRRRERTESKPSGLGERDREDPRTGGAVDAPDPDGHHRDEHRGCA